MTSEEFEIIRDALIMAGTIPTETAVAVRDSLRALLRRDWAMRVLFAKAEANSFLARDGRKVLQVTLYVEDGTDPDTARLAAAQAVYPELPADARAELGECP